MHTSLRGHAEVGSAKRCVRPPLTRSGARSQPFWSKRSRAERIIKNVTAYDGMYVVEIERDEWISEWLADLEAAGMLVGINWSGGGATGYDLTPADAARNVRALMSI